LDDRQRDSETLAKSRVHGRNPPPLGLRVSILFTAVFPGSPFLGNAVFACDSDNFLLD
jgi:hypothetical protein